MPTNPDMFFWIKSILNWDFTFELSFFENMSDMTATQSGNNFILFFLEL